MKSTLFLWLALCLGVWAAPLPPSVPAPPALAAAWPGYDVRNVTLPSGYVVTMVKPNVAPAPGRPWILQCNYYGKSPVTSRVNAPGLALLGKGWTVVVGDLGNTFGAPSALKKWDELYPVMTDAYKLSRKPVLVGVSREGLMIQGWAALHPSQVGGLYGDHAVCDIKSWPAARYGVTKGDPADWKLLMKAYGFTTEQQALDYRRNPVDLASVLAKAHIPILYTVGTDDVVVPYSQNAEVMKARLKANGGDVTVIMQPGGHQPHGLQDPAPIIKFMLRCARQARSSHKSGA